MAHWMNMPCCFTCRYWEEDARQRLRDTLGRWMDAGADIDQIDGVAEEGECKEGVPGVNIEIHGDAFIDRTTDANFLCPTFVKYIPS